MDTKEYDVIVIGSGPAGNTAAIYLARNHLKVAVITGSTIGGQLTTSTEIENYPGFIAPVECFDLMKNMLDQATRLGAEMLYENVVNVNFDERPYKITTESATYITKYVVIATGSSPRWLIGVPSQDEFKGKGISVCATCDGNFYKGKNVAVLGGGETAAVEALHLSHICKKVYLVHRNDKFRMSKRQLEKIIHTENIEIIDTAIVLEIIGSGNPKVLTGLKIKNLKDNTEPILDVNGIFLAIGNDPGTTIFRNTKLALNDAGYIVTKENGTKTNLEGIYAAGDVTDKKYKQVVVAAGFGAIAAMEINEDIIK